MKNKNKKNFFVIAEVGQNHQGKVNLALEYVKIFAGLGADAVKFQIRNNKTLFSEEAYKAKYNSENAFAKTYGKHREKLELSYKDLIKVKKECKKYKVKFMVTPFDEESLEKICKIGVDIIKIASFDLGNLPLIHRIASKKKTTVISVGGGNMKQITSSIKTLKKNVKNIIILHCNSEYPTPYQRLGLGNIVTLKKKFKKKVFMHYFPQSVKNPVHKNYKFFNIQNRKIITDQKKNILIIPEFYKSIEISKKYHNFNYIRLSTDSQHWSPVFVILFF